MSYLISHTSVAPFIQQAALALAEKDLLDRFITTLRFNPESRRQKLLFRAAQGIGIDLERQFRRRSVTELPLTKVESHPFWETVRLSMSKIDRQGILTDRIWSFTEPAFDRLVARKIHANLTGIYGYEYSSLASFTRAKEMGITTIYDVPAPETHFVRKLMDTEVERHPVLRTAYHQHTSAREQPRTARRQAEWHAADKVIVASSVTRDSFAAAGLLTDKISVVPYGAPPPIDALKQRPSRATKGKLQLLWAGSFNVRKGAHYLIESWRRHRLDQIAELKVFGPMLLPNSLCKPIPPGIEFSPSVPRHELMFHYANSDALIFPTLCDGFGMVVTEAWSQGLPVLTTRRAGAADLLRDGQNGRLFEPANIDSLADCVTWCAEHRSALAAMREPARETAAGWQWSDYRQALREAIQTA